MYETARAYVVVALTRAAGNAIPASQFSFPIFGPIVCGAIAGCGGAFLPLNKGLDPLKNGLAPNMMSALIGGTFYHLFMSTSLSDGVIDAHKKAHLIVALFFVVHGLNQAFDLASYFAPKVEEEEEETKTEPVAVPVPVPVPVPDAKKKKKPAEVPPRKPEPKKSK